MYNFSGDLFTVDGMQSLGHYLKTVRLFKGYSRADITRRTRISDQWLIKFENGTYKQVPKKETLACYCDFLGITIDLQYNYKLKGGSTVDRIRVEVNGNGSSSSGSKRAALEKTVNAALKEAGLYSDDYFSDPNNEIDNFLSSLSRESVNDTQAIVLSATVPAVILNEGTAAIYSDDEKSKAGGLEIIVKKEIISDLDNLVILLTYDDN